MGNPGQMNTPHCTPLHVVVNQLFTPAINERRVSDRTCGEITFLLAEGTCEQVCPNEMSHTPSLRQTAVQAEVERDSIRV